MILVSQLRDNDYVITNHVGEDGEKCHSNVGHVEGERT